MGDIRIRPQSCCLPHFAFWLATVLLLLPSGYAQNLTHVLPTLPASSPNEIDLDPESLGSAKGPWGQSVAVRLKGVIFYSSLEQVTAEGVPPMEGINAGGIPPLQSVQFREKMESLLGSPISPDLLDTVTREAISRFSDEKVPVIEVFVPKQNINNGVLQVVAVTGKLEEIKIRGNEWFGKEGILHGLSRESFVGLSEATRLQAIQQLNENPFVAITPEFVPGANPGTSDLILHTKEKFPLRTYSGYDNTGNPLIGYDHWTNGINWGNAFGLGHELDYQITTDNLYNRYLAQTSRYVIPLPDRQTLAFYGGYITDRSQRDHVLGHPRYHGYSWQISGRYTVPLAAIGQYEQNVSLGYDFKESNNNFGFGGMTELMSPTDISQFVSDYTSALHDDWGTTKFDLKLVLSPGGLTGQDQTGAYQFMHAGAHADYVYGTATVLRETALPYDCEWDLKGCYQNSSTNLLPSEQLGLGGMDSVRGFQEYAATGDQGGIVSGELKAPALSPASWFGFVRDSKGPSEKLVFLGFIDYGWVRNSTIEPGERPDTVLMGAGPGFRYNFSDYVSIRFDYGVQLVHPNLGDANKSRIHVAVNVAF